MTRNEKGQFAKGTTGNAGGRPKAEASRLLRDALDRRLGPEEAEQIVEKMVSMAIRGDHKAREHLFAMAGVDLKQINVNNSGGMTITVEYVRSNSDPS